MVKATVSSKGQVTLPKALRDHLGIQTGSKIRFSLAPNGGFHASHVLYEFEDLWKMVDQGAKAKAAMTFQEMNEAKARRIWQSWHGCCGEGGNQNGSFPYLKAYSLRAASPWSRLRSLESLCKRPGKAKADSPIT